MTNHYTLTEVLEQMGAAGKRLDHMGAVEAGAGNISASLAWDIREELEKLFPDVTQGVRLPLPAKALAGRTVLVTGSGCRLRDVAGNPYANVSAFIVDGDGETGTWFTHPDKLFTKPTSEFNSHLAVHNDQVQRRGVEFQTVIHAQPTHLVSLSHVPQLLNDSAYNRAILRWEPETIVQVPQGIAVLAFMVPGSQELMENNVRALRDHQVVLWAKHGIMVRSDGLPPTAVDKVEYLETGATYEIRNMQMGGIGAGLSDDEIRSVIADFDVQTTLY